MATARSVFRTHIGRALGRRYFASSTTTGTSTTTQLVDSLRTDDADEWDGATVYVASATAPKTAIVRGTSEGRIFLDTPLGSAPASNSPYLLLKGFTLDDYDEGIDFAHAESWPQLYLPVNDKTTFIETTGTIEYALTEAWRDITKVRRELVNSSPLRYQDLVEGADYEIRMGTAGLVYEAKYDPVTGANLHFIGKATLTISSADADTSLAPWQVITPGALAWLYEKGANPDEAALATRFAQEAQKQMALFEAAKQRYAFPRSRRTAMVPMIEITNDGSSVGGY